MPNQKRPRTPHQVLASTSRTAVLELLRGRGPSGVDEIASAVGLHPNTVRGHLDVLVDSGYAVRRALAPNGPGRPPTVYEATKAPDDGSNYRLLAEVLTQYLVATSAAPGRDAIDAGRTWAAPQMPDVETPATQAQAVSAVLRLLADSGFAPELSADGGHINLHHCPFRDLAQAHPDIVCGAHLGILQGALAQLDAPVAATRLLPLVQPDLCVATLESR